MAASRPMQQLAHRSQVRPDNSPAGFSARAEPDSAQGEQGRDAKMEAKRFTAEREQRGKYRICVVGFTAQSVVGR
jgi:hypothetical protein